VALQSAIGGKDRYRGSTHVEIHREWLIARNGYLIRHPPEAERQAFHNLGSRPEVAA
jgi:hypothetical protein